MGLAWALLMLLCGASQAAAGSGSMRARLLLQAPLPATWDDAFANAAGVQATATASAAASSSGASADASATATATAGASATASAGSSSETYAQAAAAAAASPTVKPYKQLDSNTGVAASSPAVKPASNGSNHQQQQRPPPVSAAAVGSPAPGSGSPMRIRFTYELLRANGSLLSQQQASEIEKTLGPAAAQRLASLLKVRSPVSGPLKAPLTSLATQQQCGFELPASVRQGIPDADLMLVAFGDHPICRDTGTLWYAQAKYCDYDPSSGRPTFGGMLICPSFFRIPTAAARVESMVHEVFHAMGFTANALPAWRSYETGATYSQVVQKSADGNHPSWLTTPRATSFARQYFSCPELPGAPVDMSTGMHWWQQALQFEIMIGRSEDGTRITPFTLAALEDTGWYTANYAAAEQPTQNKGAGCAAAGLK